MILSEFHLHNFRNYAETQVQFSPGVNILIGHNAQGKTNMLEAIYVLALTKSYRTSNDRDLIRWGQKNGRIAGTVVKRSGKIPLSLAFTNKGKRAKVNHLEQARLSSYVGQLNVVLFAPEDLNLVKGAPSLRRRFMDQEFGQMSNRYLANAGRYRRYLRQRNRYLKQLKYGQQHDLVLLDVLSDQLAASGAEVMVARRQLLDRLLVWAQQLHHEIAVEESELTFEYCSTPKISEDSTVKDVYAQLRKQYHDNQKREIEHGTTLAGPHRDDLKFLINGKNVQTFGSQGQQRTTALSVKLAEIDLMKEITGEYPLLLLDDVLSELDARRQTHLLAAIQDKVQTFLTTTSLNDVAQHLINPPTVFDIDHGTLTKEEAK